MLSLFFLTLALVATIIYFWRHRSPVESSNKYQRKKARKAPHVAKEKLSEAVIAEQLCRNEDENVREIISENQDPLLNNSANVVEAEAPKYSTQNDSAYVVALYLLSPKDESYSGYELLQALLSAGLRYGDQKIFHRHIHKDGRGSVLFHCASATPPGTFDLTKMGSFSGRGICLFFSSNEVEEPLMAFDCLLETLDQLVDDLGGEVLDETRQLFTKEKLVHHRQQLRAIESNKTTVDMFE